MGDHPPDPAAPARDARRAHSHVSLLYANYFALVGGSSPYFALFLAGSGLGMESVGVLMALPQLVRIVAPPFWGWLADSGLGRQRVLRISAALAWLALLGLTAAGGGFVLLAAGMLVLFFAMSAQNPIVESMAIALAGGDSGRYGRMRVWGSIGFIVTVSGLGMLLDRYGAASLPWWLLLITSVLLFASWHAPVSIAAARAPRDLTPVRARLREPHIAAFLISAFWMVFAHAGLYAFFSLYLQGQGYSGTAIGLLWALGVIAEILLFWWQRPLFERFGALRLLAFSLLVTALRFMLVAGSDGALVLMLLTQLMHAVTFGLHHSACMSLMQRWFPASQQARAQAGFATIAYGLGGSAGAGVSGWVWVNWSPAAVFGVSAVAALLGWIAVAFCRRLDYARAEKSVDTA